MMVNALTCAGLLLIAGSYAHLLLPARLFEPSTDLVLGLPVVPVTLLGFSATIFTFGVVLTGEGICRRYGAPSLLSVAVAGPARLARIVVAAAAAGVAMEAVARWLGRLWAYPYWTAWFYALVLLPGFAFYWLSIAESYLAAKAILDHVTPPVAGDTMQRPPARALTVGGVAALAATGALYLRWYAVSGGRPPPLWYAILALAAAAMLAEGLLSRWRRPSLLGSLLNRYWVPAAAILVASAVLAALMEPANAVHGLWAYQGWPGGSVAGVPVSVFALWPLQDVAFLLLPCLLAPELAEVFWSRASGARPRDPGDATAVDRLHVSPVRGRPLPPAREAPPPGRRTS